MQFRWIIPTRFEISDDLAVPDLVIDESRPRSPSPPPLDVLTPPPLALEPFEHDSEDAPPPLSLISDLDETVASTVIHQEQIINCESDSDSGVEEVVGLNSVDENLDNVSANSKCKQVLNKKDLEEIKRYNLKIRASIYKEVRRFGRSEFFTYLM